MNKILTILYIPFILLPSFLIGQSYWAETTKSSLLATGDEQFIEPTIFRSIVLDKEIFLTSISDAPLESAIDVKNSFTNVMIPLPNGEMEEFKIVEYSMMEPELAAQFPEIKTYRGIGVNNPHYSIRFDWTSFGLRGVLRTPEGMAYIEPFSKSSTTNYISYWKKDLLPTDSYACHTMDELSEEELELVDTGANLEKAGDCTLRSYRICVAATGEYSNFHGATSSGDVALVLSAVTTTINRVNEIFERDFGVRLILIGTNTSVFYYDGASDPYTNNDVIAMLTENTTNLFNTIGSANYDVGHVFSTSSGGVATLNSPCLDGAESSNEIKARGVTGTSSPTGDPFDIDYVCHEVGHQFGAHHTFNTSTGACFGNRTDASAYETGSGSTIMSYSGICAPNNVQSSSDAYFHAESIREVANFVTGASGNSCAVLVPTSNSAPTAGAGLDYIIPPSTPFILTGAGSDPDGDAITYCWEQWDNEISTQPPVATSTDGPNFRSFLPVTQPERYIPQLSDVIANTTATYEVLSSVARTYEFRLTVRDNSTNAAGCTAEDNMIVTVDGTASPFLVTYPTASGITWTEGGNETITWDVAGTSTAPISCSHVDILLSYDGGLTYSTTLASEVPNSGMANITVPVGTTSTTARVMVRGYGNIFYDISNNNFTINAGTSDFSLTMLTPIQSVCSPNDVSYTIDVGAIGGFSEDIVVSVSSAPTNALVSFSTNPVTPGNSTILTISNIDNVAIGTYTPTLNGSSIVSSKSLSFTVDVIDAPSTIIQSTPTNNEEGLSLSPTLTWLAGTNLTAYGWEISTDPAFGTTIETGTTTSLSTTLSTALTSGTSYFWRVRGISDCGAGSWSSVLRFTTITCLSITNNTVTPILQGGATTESVISIEDTGTISDLKVMDIKGEHNWVSDLTVKIVGPGGTASDTMTLWSSLCGSSDDFDVSFDDDSPNTYASIPCSALGQGGTYQSNETLDAFDGKSVTGDWTLEITDSFSDNVDTLREWSLFVCITDYSSADALPVNWLSFTAKGKEDIIKLEWLVSDEIDNMGYEVERRSENNEFEVIGYVEGRNAENYGNQLYQMEDESAQKGIIYQYRIRQIDESGRFTYSQIREATLIADRAVVQLFPNPAKDHISIHVLGENVLDSQVTIFDARGMKVMDRIVEGRDLLKIDHFPAGVYIVEINTNGYLELQKLVVE